jgi:hypothetical protein
VIALLELLRAVERGRRLAGPLTLCAEQLSQLALPDEQLGLLLRAGVVRPEGGGYVLGNGAARGEDRPVWEGFRRQLRLGVVVIKRLVTQAHTQEVVLQAFEDAAWPATIPNPFLEERPGTRRRAVRRLRDTVASLNRGRESRQLEFFPSPDGEEVGWRLRGY